MYWPAITQGRIKEANFTFSLISFDEPNYFQHVPAKPNFSPTSIPLWIPCKDIHPLPNVFVCVTALIKQEIRRVSLIPIQHSQPPIIRTKSIWKNFNSKFCIFYMENIKTPAPQNMRNVLKIITTAFNGHFWGSEPFFYYENFPYISSFSIVLLEVIWKKKRAALSLF